MFHYLHGGNPHWCYLQIGLLPNILFLAGPHLNLLNAARYRVVLGNRDR